MLPRPLYEVLPYLYLFGSLGLISTQSNWMVILFAWVLYTAGAITWVLRSDARRVNKRMPKSQKNLFLHEDFYESLPFLFIGMGVLAVRFIESWIVFWAGFALMVYGGYVLAIRISRRKISWIDDWRRYRGSAIQAKTVHRKKQMNPICDQCLIRESCRRTGLTDRSNILVMEWLQKHERVEAIGPLKEMVDEAEFLPIGHDTLLKVILKQQPYAEQCLVIQNRKKMRRVS
ncbi:hypothetical protein [Motiliproteus sediminis]|uniref:hypothetical protein n=1 Tax=Motiliproteus sediminis TaxID=1468178 RepID=UPI001AEFA724|nr:hypothetical protein [Motiliproteus sediminis]